MTDGYREQELERQQQDTLVAGWPDDFDGVDARLRELEQQAVAARARYRQAVSAATDALAALNKLGDEYDAGFRLWLRLRDSHD